jgi:hypothetical protein
METAGGRSQREKDTCQELCIVLRLRLDIVDGAIRVLIAIGLYLLWLVLERVLGGKPAGDLKGCA